MADMQTRYGVTIELVDKMTNNLTSMINGVQSATAAVDNLNAKTADIGTATEAVQPMLNSTWQTSNFQVFTDTGIDRFVSESQSASSMMSQLVEKQQQISANAANSKLFNTNAVTSLNTMQTRLDAIKTRITAISNNPANPVNPNASAALEALRAQMSSMIDTQEQMNAAVEDMNVERANELYNELNDTVNSTERYLRDNTDEQGNFNDAIDTASDKAQSLNNIISKAAGAMGLYKIVSMLKSVASEAVEYASDLVESQNVVDVTFGDSAEAVDEWATTTLEAFGLNELSAKSYAGTMGAMLKSSGITGDAVADMATTITELAGDLASFYNLDAETAFTKIRSGLSGETEPLKQLGINMSVANLEAYALAQGIETAYDEMSQAEQVMLRYSYLMSVTTDAQGDFSRTSDSYANQVKLLSETWTEFTGQIAESVLPGLASLSNTLNNMIQSEQFQTMSANLSAFFTNIVDSLGNILNKAVQVVNFVIENWDAVSGVLYGVVTAIIAIKSALAIQSLITSITSLTNPIGLVVAAIAAVVAIIVKASQYMNKLHDNVYSTGASIVAFIVTMGAEIANIVIGVINGVIQAVWTVFVEPFINIIEWVLTACNGGFDSFGDAVQNLLGKIISWFLSLGQVVTKIIDAIFGTDWTSGLENLKNTVSNWGTNENSVQIELSAPEISAFDYDDVYTTVAGKLTKETTVSSGSDDDSGDDESGGYSYTDYLSMITGSSEDTADSASDIADTVSSTSDEELEYLRLIAERETVNSFTTAEIKLDFASSATITSDIDVDGFINTFTTELENTLVSTAEGLSS